MARAIVWQDRRSLDICEALEAKDGAGIVDRTGMIIVPNDAATKIRWLLDNDPKVKAGVANGELLYGTIDTWLVWKLTGKPCPCDRLLQCLGDAAAKRQNPGL